MECNISEKHSSADIFVNEEFATQNVRENVNSSEAIQIWSLLKCANNERDCKIIYCIVEK